MIPAKCMFARSSKVLQILFCRSTEIQSCIDSSQNFSAHHLLHSIFVWNSSNARFVFSNIFQLKFRLREIQERNYFENPTAFICASDMLYWHIMHFKLRAQQHFNLSYFHLKINTLFNNFPLVLLFIICKNCNKNYSGSPVPW